MHILFNLCSIRHEQMLYISGYHLRLEAWIVSCYWFTLTIYQNFLKIPSNISAVHWSIEEFFLR
uniref:Putative selenium-dependant glutathione peroxidase n=1 Tax=Hottentotta judaicus TaxID=6863 RepID=F1CIU9_HOTJU|nr:putative selenium-dependant glutathione peroxidase [Hottentotta judaicus]